MEAWGTEKFRQTILGVHGRTGEQWLAGLGDLLRACEDRWQMKVGEPYTLSYNYVVPADLKDGTQAVLKLGVPSHELRHEASVLAHYQGSGMARLLDADLERGILLLERMNPGATLKSVEDDEEAVLLAAGVIRRLQEGAGPVRTTYPDLAQWSRGLSRLRQHYDGGTGPIPEELVRQAEQGFAWLFETSPQLQLLHGDLHHENILSAGREPWLAIDPKGVLGDPAFEVIPFLMNHHLPEHDLGELIEGRTNRFADALKLDKRRILTWGCCHAVLSTWWCIESGTEGADGAADGLRLAEIYAGLLQ